MTSTFRPSINPTALIWVKRSFGLNEHQMAQKLGVDEDTYIEFELGSERPTLRQLQGLSKSLKTPVAVFYLQSLPDGKPFPNDYRNRSEERPLSVGAHLTIRRALSTQEFLSDFEEWHGKRLEGFDSTDPVVLATQLRALLNYYPGRHMSKDYLFDIIRAKLEEMGILTLVLSLNTKEARGFSIYGAPPVIVVSASDAKAAQIFTILHEFAHIIKNESGLCQPFEPENSYSVESQCNSFASNFLLTTSELRKELNSNYSIDDPHLTTLAARFKTSREVILIKLIEWQREYDSQERFYKRANPVNKVLRENGNSLTTKVLDLTQNAVISYTDAANMLNVNVGYLRSVGERVGIET